MVETQSARLKRAGVEDTYWKHATLSCVRFHDGKMRFSN